MKTILVGLPVRCTQTGSKRKSRLAGMLDTGYWMLDTDYRLLITDYWMKG